MNDLGLGKHKPGSGGDEDDVFEPKTGVKEAILREMSLLRGEPHWMLEKRLKALQSFLESPLPNWRGDMSEISFDDITCAIEPTGGPAESWSDLPDVGRESLTGATAHDEAEGVFQRNRDNLERQGVVFTNMDTALREHAALFKEYFGTIIPADDNKFAALNSSVWSGGSFIYVPPGVEVGLPLQATIRINGERMGQFERTLIIADEGAKVHYIEGCSAPVYTSDPLHSAVVEIIVKPSAHVTYTTIQNWSSNVFNVVTKRAYVEAEGRMEWIDGNIGSRLTVAYPETWLAGPKAAGRALSVAYAGEGQHQDTGSKIVHLAPETTSEIVARSISKAGGRSSHRGLVSMEDGAEGSTSHVQCHALVLDDESIGDSYPSMEIGSEDVRIRREETVSTIADEQLFYLMSRGLSEQQAIGMLVNGFIEPVTRTLPMEYAVEWNRLIELQIEGSVG